MHFFPPPRKFCSQFSVKQTSNSISVEVKSKVYHVPSPIHICQAFHLETRDWCEIFTCNKIVRKSTIIKMRKMHKNSGIFIFNHNSLFPFGNYLSLERLYPPHEAIGVPELLYSSVDDQMCQTTTLVQ